MRASEAARVILGLSLAPHAGIPVLILSMCADGSTSFLACIADSSDQFLFLAWLVALCGYPPVLLLGIPMFVLLRRHGLLRSVPLAIVGIAISYLAAGLFFLIEEKFSIANVFRWIPFTIRVWLPLAGVMAGLTFWAIAVAANRAPTVSSTGPVN